MIHFCWKSDKNGLVHHFQPITTETNTSHFFNNISSMLHLNDQTYNFHLAEDGLHCANKSHNHIHTPE